MKNKISQLLISMLMITLTFTVCKRGGKQNSLSIKGSDTMVHMASAWAEHFSKKHKIIKVSVTGGGSGTGIAALINKTTDIAAASRKIKSKEIKNAAKRGVKSNEIVVARDGIAVVVNPSNPIDALSIEQIKKIFTGASANWKDLGGENEKILVLSRESSSGTYVFFQKRVLNKEDYATKARLMPATSSIIQTVSQSKAAIGYVGLGYAIKAGSKIKILGIKTKNNKIVKPSIASINNGSYSIARPLQLYTNGSPKGNIKLFIDFVLSAEGQKIVADTGYVKVK